MQSPITLINVFAVPQGKEDEFIRLWDETARIMKDLAGFVDTKLHRSLDAATRFQFVNVAHWETPEAWQASFSNPKLQELWKQHQSLAEANPALYQVEVQYS